MKKKSSFDNGLRLWHPNTTPGTSLGCATLHIIYWKDGCKTRRKFETIWCRTLTDKFIGRSDYSPVAYGLLPKPGGTGGNYDPHVKGKNVSAFIVHSVMH